MDIKNGQVLRNAFSYNEPGGTVGIGEATLEMRTKEPFFGSRQSVIMTVEGWYRRELDRDGNDISLSSNSYTRKQLDDWLLKNRLARFEDSEDHYKYALADVLITLIRNANDFGLKKAIIKSISHSVAHDPPVDGDEKFGTNITYSAVIYAALYK